MAFENLSNLLDFKVIESSSPDKLAEVLRSIPFPTKIVSMYSYTQGQKTIHVAYVLTSANIEKVKKENTNG